MISCLSTIPKVSDILFVRTNGKSVRTIRTLNTFSVWNMTDFFCNKIPISNFDTCVKIPRGLNILDDQNDHSSGHF